MAKKSTEMDRAIFRMNGIKTNVQRKNQNIAVLFCLTIPWGYTARLLPSTLFSPSFLTAKGGFITPWNISPLIHSPVWMLPLSF